MSSQQPIMVMSHGARIQGERVSLTANSANTFFVQSREVSRFSATGVYAYSSYGNLRHERRAEVLGFISQDCYTMEVGVVSVQDASRQNAGNRALQTVQTSAINCNVTPLTPTQNTDSVRFRATLQNPFADGTFTVNTTEADGAQFSQSYTIGGFTVNVDDRRETSEPLVRTVRLCADTTLPTYVPVRLNNYGSQTQILRRVSLRSSANVNALGISATLRDFRVREVTAASVRLFPIRFPQGTELLGLQTFATQATFTLSTIVSTSVQGTLRRELRAETVSRIDPQTNSDLTFCYTANRTASYQDTLFVSDGCRERAVLVLNIIAERDTTPPRFTRAIDSCQTTVQLRFDRNDGECSRGLAGGEVVQSSLQNVTVVQTQGSTNATGRTRSYTASVQNPRRDAFYTIIVRDSLGNIREVRDTIPGFTVQVRSSSLTNPAPTTMQPSPLPMVSLGTVPVTEISCQTLTVLNTGIAPIRFDAIGLARNTTISLPPIESSRFAQTTLIPGVQQTVTVCGAPLGLGRYIDTLTINRGCLSERVIVVLEADTLQRLAISRCGAVLRLKTSTAPRSFFMEQNFPNPASGQVLVRININDQALTTLQITNNLGVVVKTLTDDVMAAGEYEISADIADLPSGVYFLIIQSGRYRQTRQMTIMR